jgi:hypothetical protein
MEVVLHHHLDRHLIEVSGRLRAPSHLLPGKKKKHLLPIGLEAGWAPAPLWTLRRREKSLDPDGNRSPVIEPVAYSLYRLSYPGY